MRQSVYLMREEDLLKTVAWLNAVLMLLGKQLRHGIAQHTSLRLKVYL